MSAPGDQPRDDDGARPSPWPSPWGPQQATPPRGPDGGPDARPDPYPAGAGASWPGRDDDAPHGPGPRPSSDPAVGGSAPPAWWVPGDGSAPGGRPAGPAGEASAGTDDRPVPGPLLGHGGGGFPDVVPPVPGGEPRAPRRRRGARGLLLVAACLVAGLVGGVAGDRLAGRPAATVSVVERSGSASDGAGGGTGGTSVAEVAEAVLPSTVSIEVTSAAGSGGGSGFVLSPDGLVVTNNHVIASAADGGGRIRVLLADGSVEPATVVGRTSDYDLAVLRIQRTGLVPLAFADTDAVRVGDPVVAVGAPLGLTSTVTTGIVSALNRPVVAGESLDEQGFINAVQTDAAINPGNSGGPLVDMEGAVVGVNSAIAQAGGTGGAGGSIGLGFAIPANQVVRTTTELVEDGVATYPVIGVSLDPTYEGRGVRIAQQGANGQQPVTADGPAAAAGLQPGDVITAIDDQLVTAPDELIVAIRAREPGQPVALTVLRGRSEETVEVTLGSEPSS